MNKAACRRRHCQLCVNFRGSPTMANDVTKDDFAEYVKEEGLVTPEQVEAAKDAQRNAAVRGETIALGDALVSQGVLTQAVRANIAKLLEQRQLGSVQLGQYRLIKKLGEGGMGAVYLAEDVMAGRQVAVKVLAPRWANDPELLARFRRESKALGKLNHPNIIVAFAVGEDSGNHFFAMEYLKGEPLAALLDRGVLEWSRALNVVIQIARGLVHAHERGVIHRDIKPGNIFITDDGVAKILDLGLAAVTSEFAKSFVTQTGVIMGTPHYISPEQARGDKNIDQRTDIYSLGATFYHLLTGVTPFDGPNLGVVLMKHLTESLPNPRDIRGDIPEGIVLILERMMAKLPEDRYADCSALLIDLELATRGSPSASVRIGANRTSVAQPKRPPAAANRAAFGFSRTAATLVGSVMGVAFIGGLMLFFTRNPSRKDVYNEPIRPDATSSSSLPKRETLPAPVPVPERGMPEISPTTLQTVRADPLVDLLSAIDLASDVHSGRWEKQNGVLACPGKSESKLELPYEPPAEYDFKITFFIDKDGVYDISQILSKGENRFAFKIAGWDRPPVVGFESVAGTQVWMKENPTRAVILALAPEKSHTMLVKVRNNGLSSYIDGNAVSNWKTDYSDLTIHESLRLDNVKRIGLFVGKDSVPIRFTAILVSEVSGKGNLLREAGSRENKPK